MDESILDRARAGDGDAFEDLVSPHRRELLVHCYRSLGSLQDAEDVLQEVFVSAWRALDRFDGRSLRPWLYRIATNRCLNLLRDDSRRPQPASVARPARRGVGLNSADDPWWLEPYPDALLEAVEPEARRPATTRGSPLHCPSSPACRSSPPGNAPSSYFAMSSASPPSEVADMLGTTSASVNSSLIRARGGFRPGRAPELVPSPASAQEAAVVDRFIDAFQRGDLHSVIELLSDDARLSMPPEPIQCDGPHAVAEYLRARQFWGPDLRLVATRANGQPAFGYYLPDPTTSESRARGVIVLTISGGRISTLTRFGGPEIITRFGLPLDLERHRGD